MKKQNQALETEKNKSLSHLEKQRKQLQHLETEKQELLGQLEQERKTVQGNLGIRLALIFYIKHNTM